MEKKLTHIGYIVDGNRRWAKERGLPTVDGHRRGFDKVLDAIDFLKSKDIGYVSFYVFSTENWQRSPEEVSYLMKLIETRLDTLVKKCKKENLRCLLMGRRKPVGEKLWQKLQQAERDTAENSGMTVCICFNYGGQWEIADAANEILAQFRNKSLPDDFELTPKMFAEYLYQPAVPPLDLVVRTSGEQRISGFQLWRSAYAEFLFLDKKFPDLAEEDHELILAEFERRSRRFGK